MRHGNFHPLAAPLAKAPQQPAAISVHIDRLVLDGLQVGGGECASLQASLVAELASLFASGRLPAELRGGVSMPRLRLGDIRLHASTAPEQIGRQIARALHGGIGS